MDNYNSRDYVIIDEFIKHHFSSMGRFAERNVPRLYESNIVDIVFTISGDPPVNEQEATSEIQISITDYANNFYTKNITNQCLEYFLSVYSANNSTTSFFSQYEESAIRQLKYIESINNYTKDEYTRDKNIIKSVLSSQNLEDIFSSFGERHPNKYSIYHPFFFLYRGIWAPYISFSELALTDEINNMITPTIIFSQGASPYDDSIAIIDDVPWGGINAYLSFIYKNSLADELDKLKNKILSKLRRIERSTSSRGMIMQSILQMRSDIDLLHEEVRLTGSEVNTQGTKLSELKDLILRVEQIANNL